MSHEQLKWVVIGCLSLFGLGAYYRSQTEQQRKDKLKLQQFMAVYNQSKQQKQKSLKDIIKDVKITQSKLVCFQDLKPNYNPDTFTLYQREVSVFNSQPQYRHQHILEHQMGHEFYALRNWKNNSNEKLLCRLNDFNLSGHLLKEQRKEVNLFKEINRLEAIVQQVRATLQPSLNVAIYGKLFYDSSLFQWTIEPFFLTRAFELSKVVDRYYTQRIDSNSTAKFAIFLGGIVLAYFTIVSPLKSWLSKQKLLRGVRQEGALNDIEYFKKMNEICVKAESLLNCEQCQVKNVEMIYECGHLATCVDCHEKNAIKECPLCGKVSTKFLKIYIA